MAIKYKIMSTVKPGNRQISEKIYFPKLVGTTQVGLTQIAKILEHRTTASEADVYLIVMGLVELIPELLKEGKTVKLDKFGSFRLHAKVNTSTHPEDVSIKNIKEIRLSFRPDNKIKKLLQNITIIREN